MTILFSPALLENKSEVTENSYSMINIIPCSYTLPAALLTVSRSTLETFTGNMLGDGSIQYPNFSRDKRITGNARYAMTMSSKVHDYLLSLVP